MSIGPLSEGARTAPSPLGKTVHALVGKAFPLYCSIPAGTAGGTVAVGVVGNAATVGLAACALLTTVSGPLLMVVQGTLRGSMPFTAENRDGPPLPAPVVRNSARLALPMASSAVLLTGLGRNRAVMLLSPVGTGPVPELGLTGAAPASVPRL